MLKVCHMTSAHNRYDGRIFFKECTSLRECGYDVTLVVNDNLEDEEKNGVKIISTKFKPKNRIDRMINGTKNVYKKALEVDADIYHLHDPELLQVVKKLLKKNKKVIFDAHEDTQEQIKDKKWIPEVLLPLVAKWYGGYSANIMSKVDAIITVTPSLVEKFSVFNKKTVMITNYPIIVEKKEEKFEVENEIESYVCFAGGISEQWMHENVIDAVGGVEGLRYTLAGIADSRYLEKLKNRKSWNIVNYLGKISPSKVRSVYKNAIAGIAINDSAQLRGVGTLGNTKLFESMEAGIPVICTNYPLWKEVVEGNHCGICVNPKSVEEIKSAILYLMGNPQEAKKMGENGRKAVLEKYNWKLEEKKLVDLYKTIL